MVAGTYEAFEEEVVVECRGGVVEEGGAVRISRGG